MNKDRSRSRDDSSKELTVCETFLSIQGEGTRSGRPAFFIRLAGCNLRCRWCDTLYAVTAAGRRTNVAALVKAAARHPRAMVAVTGGEPLLQENCTALLHALVREGREVVLETNGSIDIAKAPEGVVRVIDIKCPGSGSGGSFMPENFLHLRPDDEIKFVIADEEDFAWAVATIREHNLAERTAAVLISPVAGGMEAARTAELILESGLDLRLNLQLHRIIWPGRRRGV